MSNVSTDGGHARTHSSHKLEEWVSIGTSLLLTVVAIVFFFRMQGWTPTASGYFWQYSLAWLVLGYLSIQLIVLLSTAIDSRSIGFLDSLVSLLPALTGAIIGVNVLQGIVKLSTFQGKRAAFDDRHQPARSVDHTVGSVHRQSPHYRPRPGQLTQPAGSSSSWPRSVSLPPPI